MATTAAEKSRPTVLAGFLIEHMGLTEFLRHVGFLESCKNIAQQVFVPADELVARIKIPLGRHGEIFMPGAAAAKAFCHAGAIVKVEIKMEKLERKPGRAALQVIFGKFFVLAEKFR